MHWWWRYYPLPTPMTNQNSKSTRFLTKNWSKWILKKSTCLRQKVANIFNHIFIANCRMTNIFFLNHSPNACASFEYHYKGCEHMITPITLHFFRVFHFPNLAQNCVIFCLSCKRNVFCWRFIDFEIFVIFLGDAYYWDYLFWLFRIRHISYNFWKSTFKKLWNLSKIIFLKEKII